MNPTMLEAVGGEAGCKRLSMEFYARVSGDPALHRLFPGKSFRCATEELAAFLVQFLGGNEDQTQARWWLSLRESHARFRIDADERRAWLTHMSDALDGVALDEPTRQELRRFFGHSSGYVAGHEEARPDHSKLAAHWNEQLRLDDAIAAIAAGRGKEAIELASHFASRPSVFVGLLARMVQSANGDMVDFVVATLKRNETLAPHRFAGRSLLHFASGAGSVPVVETLLVLGVDPDLEQSGGHTALYCVANECRTASGPELVRMLVLAGADVNASGGVMRATPLHMAARRGFVEIAKALIDCGANVCARDSRGVTPLQRAVNCKKTAVAQLLVDLGAW